jgi:TolB-like protein
VIYQFDAYSLDTESLELRLDSAVVPVEPQVFSVLAYLIENRDKVVGKDELIDAVWDGRAISDGALNSRINAVRRAVGDDGTAQAVIKTFPRRGFRLVGLISEDSTAETNPLAAQFDKPCIAVLPFGNLSNDPEQEYFSDGITEDLITALSRIRRFRVAARSSTFSYKGQSPDARLVAREMEARFVIEGSVRKAGKRIRLTVQLIDGGSGNHLWAESYDREQDDIFALQDELTLAIVGAVEPAMERAEQERARRKPPESLDA